MVTPNVNVLKQIAATVRFKAGIMSLSIIFVTTINEYYFAVMSSALTMLWAVC